MIEPFFRSPPIVPLKLMRRLDPEDISSLPVPPLVLASAGSSGFQLAVISPHPMVGLVDDW